MKKYVRNIGNLAHLEPIESMARIGVDSDSNPQSVYYVNPDSNRVGDPYFKVYDSTSVTKSRRVARISFLEPVYIIHSDEGGKEPWILNSSEKKSLMKFLDKPSKFSGLSNFQYTMYQWNNEYGFLDETDGLEQYDNPVDAYIHGFYDTESNLKHPSYLPSYLVRPNYEGL